MIYAYLRVSTDMQDCDNQKQGVINWLKYKGWACDEWVIEQGVSLEEAMKPPYNIKTKYYIDGVPAYRKLPYTDYLRWWRLNATVGNKK